MTSIPEALRAPLLAALMSEFPLGVVVFDAEGHFLFVNRATAEINGVPAEQHAGRHIREVVPDLWDDAEPILNRVLDGETVVWDLTGETPAAPGVIRHWSEQWFPLRGADGQVVAVAGTVLETTEQKRAEAALESAAETRERLIDLASHELRGPLTSILGFAQRLSRRTDLSEEARPELTVILNQAVEMGYRIERFLTVSDLEGDDLELAAEPVAVHPLIVDELRSLSLRHPDVQFEPDCADVVADADPTALRQIISNLLDNAAKYAGAAGAVTIRAKRRDTYVAIEVTDRGPGISEEAQARIFEAGFRAPDSAGSGKAGQGLGLYVAHELAVRSGGELTVQSQPGAGTTFRLTLPATVSIAGDDTAAAPR